MFDAKLAGQGRVALMFGGIGYARNLFATLTDIVEQEAALSVPRDTSYHFTLVDLKPACIARILVIFTLLEKARIAERGG